MEFDIESKTENNIEDMFTINILERDSKNQETANMEIAFGTYKGIKQIEIITNENTTELAIEFYAKEEYTNRMLTINSLKINNEEIPLEYKFIPTKLVHKIKNININYKTFQERIEMIKNALTLSKDNILTGIGGEGWQYKYEEVQSYNYISRSVHSYPAKVILEFGIVGIISYIGITFLSIKMLKNSDTNNISILFALMVIVLHSIIDTDMEYAHILIYVFALIASLSNNIKNREKNSKSLVIITSIILVITMVTSIYMIANLKSYNKYLNISELIKQRNGLRIDSDRYLEINRKIAEEYESILTTERYGHIMMYGNIVEYYMDSDCENKEEMLETYYEKIKQYENKNKNNTFHIVSKISVVNSILMLIAQENDPIYYEISEKYADIIIDEYEETRQDLERCLENEYNKDYLYVEKLDKMYKRAQYIKEQISN